MVSRLFAALCGKPAAMAAAGAEIALREVAGTRLRRKAFDD